MHSLFAARKAAKSQTKTFQKPKGIPTTGRYQQRGKPKRCSKHRHRCALLRLRRCCIQEFAMPRVNKDRWQLRPSLRRLALPADARGIAPPMGLALPLARLFIKPPPPPPHANPALAVSSPWQPIRLSAGAGKISRVHEHKSGDRIHELFRARPNSRTLPRETEFTNYSVFTPFGGACG